MVLTIPSNGIVNMSSIRNMYKNSNGSISMSELYKGGSTQSYGTRSYPIVPNSISSSTIPTSGPISIVNFRGTSKVYVLDDINTNTQNYNMYNALWSNFTTDNTANRLKILNTAAKF